MFKSLSIFLLLSTSHLAYSQEEVIHAQVQAMGQAGSVNPGDNSTITLNPAAISLNERYDYQAHFSISEGPDYSFASSVVDTKTAPFAMGMAYQRVNYDPILQTRELPGWIITGEEFNKRKRYDNISLAIAYPFADRRFSIGASGTVAIYNHDIQGKGVTGNMDVGIVGRPVQAWSIGVSGRNLIPTYNCRTDTERSQPCIPDLDPGLLIGNYYVVEDFGSFGLDVDIHFDGLGAIPVSIRTGIEKQIQDAQVAFGYRWEGPTSEHWVTWGVGLTQKKTGLHYAMSVPIHPRPWRFWSIQHMLAIRFGA